MIDVLEPLASRASGDPSRQFKPKTSKTTQEPIDDVPPHEQESSNRAPLFMFEDNEAVIKMLIKGRSLHMRPVSRTVLTWIRFLRESILNSSIAVKFVHANRSRTHRVNLDRLFESISLSSNISVQYVHTDIFTKG